MHPDSHEPECRLKIDCSRPLWQVYMVCVSVYSLPDIHAPSKFVVVPSFLLPPPPTSHLLRCGLVQTRGVVHVPQADIPQHRVQAFQLRLQQALQPRFHLCLKNLNLSFKQPCVWGPLYRVYIKWTTEGFLFPEPYPQNRGSFVNIFEGALRLLSAFKKLPSQLGICQLLKLSS